MVPEVKPAQEPLPPTKSKLTVVEHGRHQRVDAIVHRHGVVVAASRLQLDRDRIGLSPPYSQNSIVPFAWRCRRWTMT